MTRVLHILDHSLPLQSGYSFRTRAIIRAQMALGWEVAGLTGQRQLGQGADTPVDEMVDAIRFFRTAGHSGGASPMREWREISALRDRLGEVAAEFAPDILHVHSPVLGALAAQGVADRLGLPLLYEIRAFWEDAAVGNGTGTEGSVKYRLTRRLETRAVRRADAVAVICEGLRSDLVARGISPDKILVSPNGVDMEQFGTPHPRDAALAAQLGIGDAPVAGFIGSFYDYEGIDILIDAMGKIHARGSNIHCLLVGGGPMDGALRAAAAASPAAHAIHFVGRVPHDAVERYYSIIDILAYPRKSMRLTQLVTPLKPLEAMAQMRLVAASDIGGHRELIRDGDNGILFAPDDAGALADALTAMVAARGGWDAQRARARKFVEQERNWSSNIRRYEGVYQRLHNTRNPR